MPSLKFILLYLPLLLIYHFIKDTIQICQGCFLFKTRYATVVSAEEPFFVSRNLLWENSNLQRVVTCCRSCKRNAREQSTRTMQKRKKGCLEYFGSWPNMCCSVNIPPFFSFILYLRRFKLMSYGRLPVVFSRGDE